MNTDDWAREFDVVSSTYPKVGDVLCTPDGSPIKIFLNLVPNQTPFMYALAFVSNIVGKPPAWHCVNSMSSVTKGLKCIICRESRSLITRKFGLSNKNHCCAKLIVQKVIEPKGNAFMSLVCGVHEL